MLVLSVAVMAGRKQIKLIEIEKVFAAA